MTTFTRTWDGSYEADPADTDQAKLYADRARKLKVDIRERAEVDHSWAGDGDDGIHKKVNLTPQGADPTGGQVGANDGILYSKDVSGKTELFYINEDDEIVQLTTGGVLGSGVKTGAGVPSAVSGEYVGQRYYDTTNNGWYTCTATGSPGTWVADIAPGTVMLWSGLIGSIPTGWLLCDGTSGTPNLKGRFVVGYDAGDTDYDAQGETGGSKTHTLTVDEMPAHTHDVDGEADAATTPTAGIMGSRASSTSTSISAAAKSTGGGAAHENRPPYYTLAYIMKK